ncbi:hypothetical protein ACF08W_22010 [Streptomyces sp. NPDC015144]|uniref:hypothetical protein n=1 Tax=Streptomyces sp. NPDC015144 TaxID=3364944 RepID=UPI0036F5B7FC
MTRTGITDVFATGRRGGSLYAYRVRGRGRGAVVLWVGGRGDEPDQVFTLPEAGRLHVPVFVTVRQAGMYARRRGRDLATPEADTLELSRVEHWLEEPVRRKVPSGALLEAWNFFDDLARGLDAVHRLPRREPVRNSAYVKLFDGECAGWTTDERRAVLELTRAGTELWNSCPVIARPRSGTVPGREAAGVP